MNIRQYNTVEGRRRAVEKETGTSLPHTGSFTLDETQASTRHCENMIGITQVPLGIAGPLLLTTHPSAQLPSISLRTSRASNSQPTNHNLQPITHNYYIPLATTEGALIASVNRGCKAISLSGGTVVSSERVGTTRGPVFETTSLSESVSFVTWMRTNEEALRLVANETSAHIRLMSLDCRIVGRLVYVRFAFDTQDAMGMNMVTIASTHMSQYISEKTNASLVSVSGNFCVDKKPSWQHVLDGRGFRSWSEVHIPTTVLSDVLKTTPHDLHRVWEAKCMIGGAVAGNIGFNGHAANVIAALFLATGQDIAHVVEGSTALTTVEATAQGVTVSVSLPSVMVGTVGGGTALATQQEALAILGIAGGAEGKHAERLAQITAAAVLAGEVSELAALATNTLACAHEVLGRGKGL